MKIVLRLTPIAALVALTACTSTPPASPKLLARCTQLQALWARYEHSATFHHTGQKARAEFALYSCQQGNYEAGIRELEKMLIRGKFPIPPE